MNRYLQTSRLAFSHQPVQYLIVDIGDPMTSFTLENCIAAAKTVLSLACSIRGNRIPGFGLSVVGPFFKCIAKLDAIKGNYGKFEEGLNTLQTMAQSEEDTDGFKEMLFEAINAAMEDFKSKSDNTKKTGDTSPWLFSTQLQITFLTRKSGLEIQEYLENVLQQVPTTKLKKIMMVELKCPLSRTPVNDTCPAMRHEFPKSLGFVELLKVTASENDLEDFFKQWLIDCNTDHEHLRIIFPNRLADTHKIQTNCLQDLVLKCDISECLIHPLSLPFGNRFMIQTDFFGLNLGGSSLGRGTGNNVVIYELLVVSRLSFGGVCESALFGQPLRLSPTQCWRLEWTSLLINQQSFAALCNELAMKEEFLLTQLKPHSYSDQVLGYFILVPGEGNLLLKAVSPGELTLPEKSIKFDCGTINEASPEVQENITTHINGLPFYSEYDPRIWKSGLCSALSKHLLSSVKPLPLEENKQSKVTSKKKAVAPNVLVKEAINKANYHGRGQKRTHGPQN